MRRFVISLFAFLLLVGVPAFVPAQSPAQQKQTQNQEQTVYITKTRKKYRMKAGTRSAGPRHPSQFLIPRTYAQFHHSRFHVR